MAALLSARAPLADAGRRRFPCCLGVSLGSHHRTARAPRGRSRDAEEQPPQPPQHHTRKALSLQSQTRGPVFSVPSRNTPPAGLPSQRDERLHSHPAARLPMLGSAVLNPARDALDSQTKRKADPHPQNRPPAESGASVPLTHRHLRQEPHELLGGGVASSTKPRALAHAGLHP